MIYVVLYKTIFREEPDMSVLVAKQAPDFTAPAVMPEGVIKEDFKNYMVRLIVNKSPLPPEGILGYRPRPTKVSCNFQMMLT